MCNLTVFNQIVVLEYGPSPLSQSWLARPKSLVWVCNPDLGFWSADLDLLLGDGSFNIQAEGKS